VRRKNGIPFAEARIGIWRRPLVRAYGRTLRTARSRGSTASGCLVGGDERSGEGEGRTGGKRFRPLGRAGIIAVSDEIGLLLSVVEAVRRSRIYPC
jgi:hypothetical protein